MGGSSSSVAKEYIEILHAYSKENHQKDPNFLSRLLSAAPNRAEAPPVDPLVLNEIASSKPENIKTLLKECVKFIEVLQDSDNDDTIPTTVHNQLSLVLQLFTTTMTVLARNPAHRSLLFQALSSPNQKITDDSNEKKSKKSKKYDSDESDDEDEKPKKSKKSKKVEESDDEDEKPKKKSKKSKKDESEDEDEKPKKSKKSKKVEESDDEDEKPKKKSKKSKKDESEDEDEKPKKKSKKSKKDESEDEDEDEKPKKKSKKLIVEENETSNKAHRSELSILSRFMSAAFKCLFKKNITLTTNSGVWEPASVDHESVALSRYDLVHSIIALTNIQVISHPVKPLPKYSINVPQFRSDLFLLSLCQIASDFVVEFNTGAITLYSAEMLKNCLALVSDFVTKDPVFYKGFAAIPADKAIAAFTGTPVQKELIFDPTSAFSSASLSFLYVMSLYNKKFIKELGKSGLSNRFVFDLIYTIQFSFERVGVCYVHSILISTLMLILYDKNAVKELMKPQTQRLLVNFKPHSQTYADLLIEIILNLSGNESLLPSIVCLYHLISINVDEISMNATFKLLVLFEKIAKKCLERKQEKDIRLTEIFMEAFVRNITHGINLRVLLIQKAAIFRKLDEDEDLEFNDSLTAIIAFLDKAKKLMSKANKKIMQTQEAIDFFKNLDVEDLFDDLDIEFEDHPHAFVGEMKKTWNEWSDMLALKSYETESNLLKQAIKV